ncbi:hypothetical protein ASH01_21735 [Terrabacter sp. Soil811]|uniref:DUF3806 domain-containing protein n=1 Tax=Terrabacter sp. Soil811 TaxID=1736419 RepID=UPI0006F2F196|nr:DUF3806 domain-containing protein [Terrabacter sp. Soil811]KRF47307.1 hypothetical protein ASH01_21735 [Terrabacter sp. Soil811]
MGLFSRKGKDDTDEPAGLEPGVGEDPDDALSPDVTGRPVAVPLGDEERDRIASALEHAAAEGVDVDDLASIGAHYDTAYRRWADEGGSGEGPDVVVETYAVAIGEHLARHSARDWAVVTDVFGTDLGLVAARADTVVVPHNLVGARWMRGETGWVPGVVSHLVSIRPRSR